MALIMTKHQKVLLFINEDPKELACNKMVSTGKLLG